MVIVERTPYKSIEVETETEEVVTLSEGNKIRFITESDGELKEGVISNLKGSKPDKVQIEITPIGKTHKETWDITDMVEGSLKLVNDNQNETDNEENTEE